MQNESYRLYKKKTNGNFELIDKVDTLGQLVNRIKQTDGQRIVVGNNTEGSRDIPIYFDECQVELVNEMVSDYTVNASEFRIQDREKEKEEEDRNEL